MKPDKTIAEGVGPKDMDGLRHRSLRMYGSNVYLRKCCMKPDVCDTDGKLLVVLRDKIKLRVHVGEVLAIGPECREPIEVGDFAILPECAGSDKMWRGCLGEHSEVIIDESEIVAVMPS